MLTKTLTALFNRDLNKLKAEIELYQNEKAIWFVGNGIANSAGNLCLHLIGNLNAYVGAVLGNTGYVRQRDLEFSTKNVPRKELIERVEATVSMVTRILETVTDKQLNNEYPLLVFKEKMSTQYFLVHLTTHLSYHLGQINYHRRILDKS